MFRPADPIKLGEKKDAHHHATKPNLGQTLGVVGDAFMSRRQARALLLNA
jgi:hypothetical protein